MHFRYLLAYWIVSQIAVAGANKIPIGKLLDQMIRRSTLTEPGGKPFYLKATITDKDDAKSDSMEQLRSIGSRPQSGAASSSNVISHKHEL